MDTLIHDVGSVKTPHRRYTMTETEPIYIEDEHPYSGLIEEE
jgi:hypothetical protein